MSHANMSSPFSAAIFNVIRTESLETKDKYVMDAGTLVVTYKIFTYHQSAGSSYGPQQDPNSVHRRVASWS